MLNLMIWSLVKKMRVFEKKLKEGKEEFKELKRGNYLKTHRRRFIETFENASNYISKDDALLDIGCVPSFFISTMKRMGYNIKGVDIQPEKEKDFLKLRGIEVKKCNIEKEKIPFEDNSFNFVFLNEVLEHLYTNPLFAMRNIKRVLKKGGYLILTTPNGYSLKRIFYFLSGKGWSGDIFTEFSKLDNYGYHGHIREYSSRELKDFLRRNNFEIEKVSYINAEHRRIKNIFLRKIFNIFYFIFRIFRTQIEIIARNIK
jgi:2-polyprenyl-3-methyl-5-hydroxy-6-metoxy-1,4-benzoquinol methylase